jgi:asparagine synthase (glutamine-hydrolysing)
VLARARFSGAFGADAATVAAQLLTPDEATGGWALPATAALAYLRVPGAPSPRSWADASGRVTLFADVRLWDGAAVRAGLIAAGCRFQTEDAGEVLLHLYLRHGAEFGRHCRGMFVAAIVDAREAGAPRLTLARDPLGGRGALYYARRGDALAFSSTLRSLRRWAALSLEPNLATVRQYLTYAFVPGAETLIAGCREVLPGQVVTARRGADGQLGLEEREYWSPEEGDWDDDAPVEAYATPLRALLEGAVAERHPGGPVAVLLSGGLDSSAVTALAARADPGPVHTFSISFGAPYPNELPFSSLVADYCGTRHTILTVTGKEIAAHLPETTARLDGPIGDPLTVPNLLLARAASGVSDVILNGEGGDPCFGGPKNPSMFLHELYAADDPFARERSYLRSYQKCYDDLPQLLTPRVRTALEREPPQEAFLSPFFDTPRFAHYLNKLMNINVRLKGSHQILHKVDRMAAAWGLEGRSPLFDRRVVEFSFGIPPRWKRSGQEEKYVLKRAVWDLLPDAILTRPKSGMLVPVQGWFRGELRGLARELLLGRRARQRDILDQATVREWLEYRGSLFPRHGIKLWLLLALELYFQAFLDAPRSAPVLPVAGRGV